MHIQPSVPPGAAKWTAGILVTLLAAVLSIAGSIVYANETARIDRIEGRTEQLPGLREDVAAMKVKVDYLYDEARDKSREERRLDSLRKLGGQ